jgi:hypothetical protein
MRRFLLSVAATLAATSNGAWGHEGNGYARPGGGFAPEPDVQEVRFRPRRFRIIIPIIIERRFAISAYDGPPGLPPGGYPYGGGGYTGPRGYPGGYEADFEFNGRFRGGNGSPFGAGAGRAGNGNGRQPYGGGAPRVFEYRTPPGG